MRANRKTIENHARLLQVVEIVKKIHSTLDLDDILSTFLEFSVKELETEGGTIYFLDPHTRLLESRHVISKVPVEKIVLKIGQGIAGQVAETGNHVIVTDTKRQHRFSDTIDRKSGYRTENVICFPLKDENSNVIGVLQLVNKKGAEFSESDASFLCDISTFAAMAIRNAQHHSDSIVKARMEQEIHVASDIQKRIIPRRNPEIEGFQIYGFFQPCYETAGDFYHYYSTEDAEYLVLIDVSGKGVGAAMVANAIHTFLKLRIPEISSLPDLATSLNHYLYSTLEGEKYATGIIIRISEQGDITYLSAGHPPILQVGRGEPVQVASTSPPFGILPDMIFAEAEITVAPGDTLCLYSDGFNETPDESDDEFGVERLVCALTEADKEPPSGKVDHINRSIQKFQGNAADGDDKTMILIRKL